MADQRTESHGTNTVGSQDAGKQAIVLQSLRLAEENLSHGNFGKAFAHYLLVLKLAPEMAKIIRPNFNLALREWTNILEDRGHMNNLFECYEQALELDADNEIILNDMGTTLFRLGFKDEAASCFRKALRINCCFVEAKENLNNASSALVERWNFRMLNDLCRNQAYKTSIEKAIRDGHDNVLDIGAGTSILSMFAVEAGAKHVYACEMSKTMYQLARDVLVTNHMSDKVVLMNMKSTDMVIPRDLPEKVSLVVTETMDAGLFGEGILETLRHAWQHLLSKYECNGKVIPRSATVFAQIIECDEIRRQHRVFHNQVGNLRLNCDVVSASMAVQCGLSEEKTEPYSTEILSQIGSGYRPLTQVFQAISVDFNNPQMLCSSLPCGPDVHHIVPVTKSGRLDAIVAWFTLHLDDSCQLSTSPGDNSCWEQAVFAIHPNQYSSGTGKVQVGDRISVHAACRNDHLSLRVSEVTSQMEDSINCHHDRPGQSADRDLPQMNRCHIDAKTQEASHSDRTSPSESRADVENSGSPEAFVLSSEGISRINDGKYQNMLYEVITCVLDRHKSRAHTVGDHVTNYRQGGALWKEPKDVVAMDIASSFSLAGLYVAKTGVTKVFIPKVNGDCKEVLQFIARSNGINDETVEYCEIPDDTKAHLLMADVIESSGMFRQRVLEDIAMAKCSLHTNGTVMPCGVTINAMCIHSASLQRDSCVSDQRTLGLRIAPFINMFQTSIHLGIDMSTLPYQKVTDEFQVMDLDLTCNTAPGTESPPLYLGNTQTINVSCLHNSSITAILFWFDIHLDQHHTICTADRETHWKQAAVVMETPVEVCKGQTLQIRATLKNSYLDITVT